MLRRQSPDLPCHRSRQERPRLPQPLQQQRISRRLAHCSAEHPPLMVSFDIYLLPPNIVAV
jgi:hypothetical protein